MLFSFFAKALLLFFLCISLYSPCSADVTLPYGLIWKATPQECFQKIKGFGFLESNLTIDNPFHESLEKMDSIAAKYGLKMVRYANQEKSPTTVIYLEYMDNKLWQFSVRYNFFDEVPKSLIRTTREKIYSNLLKKFGKELQHQQTGLEDDVISVYGWIIGNTMILFSYNKEQPEPYLKSQTPTKGGGLVL